MLFVKKFDGGDFLILLLYVDNMLIVGQDPKKIRILKKVLSKSFAMKDMGPAKQILGMHIVQDRMKKLLWFTREVRDKGSLEVQHGGCETGRVHSADKL